MIGQLIDAPRNPLSMAVHFVDDFWRVKLSFTASLLEASGQVGLHFCAFQSRQGVCEQNALANFFQRRQ